VTPIYIAFAVVVLAFMAVIGVLLRLLTRQQEQHIKVQDDLNNRLMTHTWEEYVVNRRVEASDNGARKAEWKPGDDDNKLPVDPTPDYHPDLGAIR